MTVGMRLYLVQHALSKSKEEDPSRPLSERGWKDIRKMAKHVDQCLHIQVSRIVHSGKLRAQQTAEVLAEHLQPANGVVASEDLDPLTDPKAWKSRLAKITEDTMLVGHLPHFAKLASLLLTGDENKGALAFRNGGIACLERDKNGRWSVQWLITPEIIA